MIRVTCPHCARLFDTADANAGKAARCSGCRGVIRIPEAEPEVFEDFEVVEDDPPARKPAKPVKEIKPAKPREITRPESKPQPPARRTRDEEVKPRRVRSREIEEDIAADEDAMRKEALAAGIMPPTDASEDLSEHLSEGLSAGLSASGWIEEEDDDDGLDDLPRRRPRRGDSAVPKKKKKKKGDSTESKLFMALAIGLSVLFIAMGVPAYFFKGGAIMMLVVGVVPVIIGTRWILYIAAEESPLEYYACLYVPLYDSWFALSRWGETWPACVMCWIGRVFSITAGLLLAMHFMYDKGGDWPRPGPGPAATASEIDAEAERLLKGAGSMEARAWMDTPGRRFAGVTVGGLGLRNAVTGMYECGAVRVTACEVTSDEDGDDPTQLVVELPAAKEKREAVFAYLNRRLRGEDDGRRTDRGQKYEVVPTD